MVKRGDRRDRQLGKDLHLTYTANETGFYAYYNGSLALAVE
jgi:hypothetical protein